LNQIALSFKLNDTASISEVIEAESGSWYVDEMMLLLMMMI
jgi:hypothetical protein